jgi:hypothetical protein
MIGEAFAFRLLPNRGGMRGNCSVCSHRNYEAYDAEAA